MNVLQIITNKILKTRRKGLLLWLFMVCVLSLSAEPMPVTLSVNGTPCLYAENENTWYVAVYLPSQGELNATLAIQGKDGRQARLLSLDGKSISTPTTTVTGWNEGVHTLVFTLDGTRQECGLVFSSLPIVKMDIDMTYPLDKERSAPAKVVIADALSRLEGSKMFESDAWVHYRGGSTLNYDKKSFTVQFVNEKGKDRKATLLNIRRDDKWILDAMTLDPSRMRNRLCFDIYNGLSTLRDAEMLRNGSRGEYVELLLNGSYHGLFCLSDKVNRSLLGLKKAQGQTIRGLLYKCSTNEDSGIFLRRPDTPARTDTTHLYCWELKHPDELPSETAWQPLLDLMDFCMATADNPQEASEQLFNHFE